MEQTKTQVREAVMPAAELKWTRAQMAARLASDVQEGTIMNLGVGLPTLVGNHLPKDREILIQVENGILGAGPNAPKGEEDWDLVNAGKQAIQLLPGASLFHHADSFAMMRGGHIDICVIGAYQVALNGDLANWSTGEPGAIPAIGGAMDLAAGAKELWVLMEHSTKSGESKLVERCTYPLTGLACVTRIYSDLAVIALKDGLATVLDIVPGMSFAELQKRTAVPLVQADG